MNNTMSDKIKLIDPFTNIDLLEIPVASQENQGAIFLSNLRELNIGNGGSNVFRADQQGIWLGGKTFALATFNVTMAGAVTASMFTVVGGTIRYGKTSWADNAHDGYYFGTEGLYAGKAADATIFKFTIATGALQYGGKVVAGTGSDIAAGYISGSITASQIGSVNASAITGGITSGQITSVAATTITGSITASQISSVNASAISGTITASQIASVNASAISGTITAGQIASITAGQITGQITGSQITNLAVTGEKIDNLTITGGKIATSTITANKMNVSYLSAIVANMGTITAGTFKVSDRINIQKSDTTAVAYLGQDPNSANIWGFIAERGYGLMCRYSGSNYFRIFMDSGSTDAVIDMPSPNKIKIQDNEGNAITRFYGRNAGFTNLGGLDMLGALRLYTSSTPPNGASNGMMFYHTTYHEVWVFKNGAWKALAYVA